MPGKPNGASGSPTAVPLSCLIGQCSIGLSHQTLYEPPLYLFPELLNKVPQGTPPLTAWDAVADAVDVPSSFWRLAEMDNIKRAMPPSDGATSATTNERSHDEDVMAPPYGTTEPGSRALSTLAAMLGANRLLPAGLTAAALQDGSFSAASVIEELTKLQKRAGLAQEEGDDSASTTPLQSGEGALLMSNHFVNLLAWRKLKEMNDDGGRPASGIDATARQGTAVGTKRRRADANLGEGGESEEGEGADDLLEHLAASPDPWSSVVDERRYAGKFISGRDENADQKVKLLETLSGLYGRPWKRMHSQGVQTDHVVPRGSMNASSPFADPFRSTIAGETGAASGPATLDVKADLGWGTVHRSESESARAVLSPSRAGFSVVISPFPGRPCDRSAAASETHGVAALDNDVTASQPPSATHRRVALTSAITYFGRVPGAQSDPRTGPLFVDVGLAATCANDQQRTAQISALHFALILKPEFGDHSSERQGARGELAEDDGDGDDEGRKEQTQQVHRKTPTGFALYILNYGRNGVRIRSGTARRRPHPTSNVKGELGDEHTRALAAAAAVEADRWVLGDPVRLYAGSEIIVADAAVLRVVTADDDEDENETADAADVKKEHRAEVDAATSDATCSLSQVKREREEE